MRDTGLYRHLLGLVSPWEVSRVELSVDGGRVELSVDGGRVDVWAEHPKRTRFACPECAGVLSVYDHAEERAWRHLDSCAFLTYLHASPPRVECPTHGVRQVALPWAEPMSRFHRAVRAPGHRRAQRVRRRGGRPAAAPQLGRGVALDGPGRRPGPSAKPHVVPALVGVEEKTAGRGQDYITVVSNLETGCVEYLADERRQTSLDGFFDQFSAAERTEIAAVAMDMWDPYITSTRDHLDDPDKRIVFDRYHLMKYLTGAVDTVRKQEHRALAAGGDKSLSGTKYLWLYSEENLPERHQDCFGMLRGGDLKTARAWAIKEPAPLVVLQAPGLGRKALEALVLLGHPFAAPAGDRRGPHLEASRVRAAVVLRPPGDQRRRGGPQLAHPGDPGLRSRLSQPGALVFAVRRFSRWPPRVERHSQ